MYGSAKYCRRGLTGGGGSFTSIAAGNPNVVLNTVGGVLSVSAGLSFIETDGSVVLATTSTAAAVNTPSIRAGSILLPQDRTLDYQSCPIIAQWNTTAGVRVTGTDVDSWIDLSGCGATATATGTARPTFLPTGWSDSGPCFSVDGTTDWMSCDEIAPHMQGNQPRSITVLVRPSTVAGSLCYLGGGDSTGGSELIAYQANGLQLNIFCRDNAGGLKNLATGTSDVVTTRDQLITIVHAGALPGSAVYIDGRKVTLGDAFPGGVNTPNHFALFATLVGGVTPANFFAGLVRAVEVRAGAANDADYVKTCQRLLGRRVANVVHVGNSLTQGVGGTGGNTYPLYLQNRLGGAKGKSVSTNLGVSAQTTQQMLALYVAQVRPLLSTVATNVLCVWEINNDILLNQLTPTAAVANYWTYINQAVADGWNVIAFTSPPRGDFNGVGALGSGGTSWKAPARIVEANALVMAGFKAHGCFGVVDLGAAPQLQDTANANIYADTIHDTNAGYQIVAGLAANPIDLQLSKLG